MQSMRCSSYASYRYPKSFALRNGGGCPELKELLEKALDMIGDENEN